jgi:hypothetical protein
MNYDPKVYELVKHFLEAVPENTERNRQLLAQHLVAGGQGGSVMAGGEHREPQPSRRCASNGPGSWRLLPRLAACRH